MEAKKLISGVFAAALVAALHGCGGGDGGNEGSSHIEPSDKESTEADSTIRIGAFNASYYDGDNFVASESVDRPSIKLTNYDFHNIPASNFRAVWRSDIEVANKPKIVEMNFMMSRSDVSLFVDGVKISSWTAGAAINPLPAIRHELEPGKHEVRIELTNKSYTLDFDSSFNDKLIYSKEEARSAIAPLIDEDTQILYVGAYESADRYLNSILNIGKTSKKIFLFLSSYSSMNWVIKNPYNVKIAGIVYGSYYKSTKVEVDQGVPTFQVADFPYGYHETSEPSAYIEAISGRKPGHIYVGQYSLPSPRDIEIR